MAIDPNIKQKAENIRLKKKGREVRESLAAGLEAMSEDVVSTVARQGNVEEQFQEVIDNTTGKDVISAPELIAARNGKPNLKTRIDDLENETNAQLAQTVEGVHEKSVNVLALGAKGDELSDDTEFIQTAMNKAAEYSMRSNAVGGTNYYRSNGKVKIPPGMYGISNSIKIPEGIDIDMEGAIFICLNQETRFLCFDITSSAYRNKYIGGTFVGFAKAVKLSTGNKNTSKVTFDGIVTHNCDEGIDTTSFEDSRSTVLTIKNFESIQTNKFLITHTDMTILKEGWIDHTGYNGAAIENHSFLKMENVICVPHPTKSGARPRWIDNYSVPSIHPGERGLTAQHCRFGAEAGSCPVVFNYASRDGNYAGGYAATRILIDDSTVFSSGAAYGDSAVIVLFDMPNRISITNCSGISNLLNGLIVCDSSFDSTTVSTNRNISIYIDSASKGSTDFPLISEDLKRFLMTDDTPYNAFRQTFKDGNFFKRYNATSVDDITAKVTLKMQTLKSVSSGAMQKNLGFSFLVSISSSFKNSYMNKAHSTYLVSMSGGTIDGISYKRLNFSELNSHGGGLNFESKATVNSVHWGSGLTGSTDALVASAIDDITITFDGGPQSTVTILPLWGIDNYS